MSETISIATSAMMVELNISCWTARKLDKNVSKDIDAVKNTKVRAGNYHKHLLAGNPHHEAVVKYAASSRLWNIKQTMPWSDSGPRIVTMENLFNGGYKRELDNRRDEFYRLVDVFLGVYPTLISAAAFQLGDLFDREEYPDADVIRKLLPAGLEVVVVALGAPVAREVLGIVVARFNGLLRVDARFELGDGHRCVCSANRRRIRLEESSMVSR